MKKVNSVGLSENGNRPLEIDVRRWFKKHWPNWCEFREPARGVGTGSPDCLAMVRTGELLPIEFKVGWVVGDSFKSTPLRPAQMEWHRTFVLHGGIAFIAIGYYDDGGDIVVGLTSGRNAHRFRSASTMEGLQLEGARHDDLYRIVQEMFMEEVDALGGPLDQRIPAARN